VLFRSGVLWRTRTGAPWRDLPGCYGRGKTVYNRHRRWSAEGTWARIADGLRRDADRAEGADWAVGVDSAVVRAHQHAAGARHEPPTDVTVAVEVVAAAGAPQGGGGRRTKTRPTQPPPPPTIRPLIGPQTRHWAVPGVA